MKKKLISILITNFNKEKFLKKTLSSVVSQNFKDYEIILFDDASTDSSLNIIKKFREVKLIKNLNINSKKSAPLNQIEGIIQAFKFSKGNIVCLLDSDDIFKRNKLKRISLYFKKNFNKKFVVNLTYGKKDFYLKKINPNRSIWPTVLPTSCISFKRDFFENYLKFIKKNNFHNLEIDSRLMIYAHHYCDDFNILHEKLTKYEDDEKGITSKYKKFSLRWWLKRHEAFQYLIFILRMRKKLFLFSFDYYLTRVINFLIKVFIR